MWSLRRISFLALLAGSVAVTDVAVAQSVTTGDEMFLRMREVGDKLRCQCASQCSYTVASCNMLRCSFRETVNPDIREALQAGLAPDAIVEKMIAKYGAELRTEPLPEGFGLFGWAMPFVALAVGLVIVPFVVLRWKKQQRPAAPEPRPIDEQVLAEYEAAIERDLAESE